MDFGLTLAVTSQSVGTQIDLIPVVTDPANRMTKFVNLDPGKMRRILKRTEHAALQ